MKPTVTALVIAAAVLVVAAWLLRYEVTAAGAGAAFDNGGNATVLVLAYRLDRWTGEVCTFGPTEKGDCSK